jgi:hypothetical protein
MRLALGETVTSDEMPRCNGLSYLFYVQAPATMRTITSIEGLDALRAVDGVQDVVLNRVVGQHVDWREGNHGHVLSVFGTTADHDGLRRVDGLVSSLVRIEGT